MFIELLKYHYNLVAANGQVLLTSEQYKTHWNAKRAANRVAKAFGLTVSDAISTHNT